MQRIVNDDEKLSTKITHRKGNQGAYSPDLFNEHLFRSMEHDRSEQHHMKFKLQKMKLSFDTVSICCQKYGKKLVASEGEIFEQSI